MGFNCGIVGLPNVGKSTLFNAVTRTANAQAANYPFCTIEPNVGRVAVPDERMEKINAIIKAKKIVPTFMEFVDIAGLVKGASRGEGLGNQFLGHIKQVDAIVHVVRCFEDSNITHVDGNTDPARDVDTINTELIYCDFETVSKSIDKMARILKNNDKKIVASHECGVRLKDHLEQLKPARTFLAKNEDEDDYLKSLHLITRKQVLYAANVNENELADNGQSSKYVKILRDIAEKEGAQVVVVSARLEEELGQLEPEDAKVYMDDLNIKEAGLDRLIKAGYSILGLMTYFTAGVQEIRAWTIPKNCKAPQAAGVIHTDFEKGFICAEVYAYDDLMRLGSEAKVKESGLYRKEGRDYSCKDGDIMNFLFNV
ncbi:redox-regulated ATPase YchF [Fluviispira multicolorata]|uniref:Ribosome-binding ATPase YchF n=1 Tax=Fluviispira multicolorata TaxID=2654512 RepID=A0A833JCR0_9BACT|nr:redox-regulated ATPase YchF [Fluviispira multicolorata]KAB8030702.1 redox-regulated ATPase YchF [Fluviispira multicolorata]